MQNKSENNFFWQRLEKEKEQTPLCADELIAALKFNDDGLLPVVVQCADSRQVLMMAWTNREALQKTLGGGLMTYYSRSRQQLWRKGETSGHIQQVVELYADCDGDTLLAVVKQTTAACHSGRYSCFYARIAPTACISSNEEDS